MRKKQSDQCVSLSEQIDVLNRAKSKLEKEKSEAKMEVDELQVSVESLTKGKLNFEKQSRNLEDAIAELRAKYEENQLTISEQNTGQFKNSGLKFFRKQDWTLIIGLNCKLSSLYYL